MISCLTGWTSYHKTKLTRVALIERFVNSLLSLDRQIYFMSYILTNKEWTDQPEMTNQKPPKKNQPTTLFHSHHRPNSPSPQTTPVLFLPSPHHHMHHIMQSILSHIYTYYHTFSCPPISLPLLKSNIQHLQQWISIPVQNTNTWTW